MDLKDFVRESLVQIANGISEANEALKSTGALVNPSHIIVNSDKSQAYGRTGQSPKQSETSRIVERVDFDVAVVAEKGDKMTAGLKLSVASVSLGAGEQSEKSNRSESRIKFSIPVVFPGVESKDQ